MDDRPLHSPLRQAAWALLACAAMFFAGAATAQTWPGQPIHLVVPYTPGTGYDNIAREVSPLLGERLGQPVVVDNRPGASSLIGAEFVAASKPDGYTIMIAGEGTMASALLYQPSPVDPLTRFVPITLAGYGTLMLVTGANSGIKTVADLVAKAKASPGKLSYASPGVGTSQHLKMEMIKDYAGIDMLHVPYKGSAGALNDLIGGQVDAALVPVPQAVPQVKAGHLTALAVISPQRSPRAPDVPTLKEAGINGIEANMWYGFMAPRDTPPEIIARLNTELRAILAQPDVKTRLEDTGLDVATGTPAQLRSTMEAESASAGAIITKHHISLN